MTEKRKTAKAS
jgi:hypothetical protein